MRALDTNAFVRFLVRDDEKQAQAVKKVLIDAEHKRDIIFIPFAVTLETIWVLSSAYDYSREDIIRAFEHVLGMSVFRVEQHERIASLCTLAGSHDCGLADLLIGLTSRDNGCESTLTFDKKAARSALFTLIR